MKWVFLVPKPYTGWKLACVASISSRGSSRKLGQEQPFFCFLSNFRAITRLETLATQASWKHTLAHSPHFLLSFGAPVKLHHYAGH